MKKEVNKLIITMAIGITPFILLDIFIKIIKEMIIVYFVSFPLILGIIFFTLFWMITKETSKSIKYCYILIYIFEILNIFKIKFTGNPIYLTDILLLKNIGGIVSIVKNNISIKMILIIILELLISFLVLMLLYIVSKKNNIKEENLQVRVSIIILDILALVIFFCPFKFTNSFFLKYFFNSDKIVDYDAITKDSDMCDYYGYTSGIYFSYLSSFIFEPNGYDEEKINAEIQKVSESHEKIENTNIVVVFSEAFWDLEKLDEIKFNKNITENFNKLKNDGYLVDLISPTYGGLSENVTFEFLTGYTMNYFSDGYIPIMSLYNGNYNTNSLIKELKNNDYHTKITFMYDAYKSEKSYKKIGFDEYIEIFNILEDQNEELNDEKLSEYIIDDLKSGLGEKNFSVYSSFENHMPYYLEKYDEYDIEIKQSSLSEEENEALLAYAQGVYNADKQLAQLYDYIKEFDEPTILIFTSDHLPYLYTNEYDNLLGKLKYFNTNDELENYYRKYNTQALVLSNYDISNLDIPNYLGYNLFLNHILNRIDINIDQYYKWLDTTESVLPAGNKIVTIDAKGNKMWTSKLENEIKNMYNLRNCCTYKMLQY